MNRVFLMFKFHILTFISCSVILLAGCSDPKVESQDLTEKGRQYVASNNLREAAIEFKNALQLDADNAQARFLLGKINLQIGDSASAVKELSRAKSLGLTNDEVNVLLAEALMQQREFLALVSDDSFTSLSNNAQANILAIHAIAYSALKQTDKAREMLDSAEKIDNQALWLLLARSKQQMINGDFKSADTTIQTAIAKHPSNQDVWLLKAELGESNNDKQAISEALNKVIELEPPKITSGKGWRAHLGLVKLAIANKDIDGAERSLKPLLSRNPNDPEVAYLQGLIAFQQNKYELAEEKLLQVLKAAPNHAPTSFLLGTIHYQNRNYEQAVYYLSSYVAAEPANKEARKLLGRTYIALGQPSEAQAILRENMGNESVDPEVIALIGLSELQGGNKAEGIGSLRKAVEAAPDDVRLRFTLARAYISDGKTKEAISELDRLVKNPQVGKTAEMLSVIAYVRGRSFDRALSLAADLKGKYQGDASIVALIASVHLAKNDPANGRKYLEDAVALKPDYAGAIMELASLDEREGKLEQASENYQKVIALVDSPASAMIALARISAKTGDIEGTGRWLSKSRDSAPDQILPQVLLAEYYLRQNKLDQAETVVNDLVKTDAGHPSSLALQGQLYMLKKQYNQALKPLQDLVKAAPKAALSHRLLGEAWFAVKDYRKGSESFEKVVSLDPKNLVALNNLAWYYDTINDPKALKYAESAYKLTSDNPAVQDTYGWILVKKGEITKGHGLLEEASNALKGVPEVTYHLAVAKIKLDKAEGKVMLEELLASGKDFEGQADAKKLLESL